MPFHALTRAPSLTLSDQKSPPPLGPLKMFKFGFQDPEPETEVQAAQDTAPAAKHSLDLLKKDFPRISYTCSDLNGSKLPRRDIFDVRYQLMAMDELDDQMKILLGNEDVRKNVYEGGLKVWEGALDLVQCLQQAESASQILELGCGAAVPSCYLLYQAIKTKTPARIVVADYNEAILRFLTIPNCILAWLAATQHLPQQGEVNLTAEVIDEFDQALNALGIQLEFISGGWSRDFSTLVGDSFDLVLASETIYSLESLDPFCSVVDRALTPTGRALVAAKKVYFGVGGSVVEFQKRLDKTGLKYKTILNTGDVGRVVIEVTH